jgi:hypothetical protein
VASLWKRLRTWWNKDALELAGEETRMTPAERDIAQEDYEGHKDDILARGERLAGGAADYERDSNPPRDPEP